MPCYVKKRAGSCRVPGSPLRFRTGTRQTVRLWPGGTRKANARKPVDNTMLLESTPRKIIVGNVPQNALGYRDHCMQTNLGDGSNTDVRTHEFATKPTVPRKALELHQEWIEATLGCALADVVIFQVDLNLAQIAVEKILACSSRPDATSRVVRRLRPLVVSANIPPGFPPLVELSKLPHRVNLRAVLEGSETGDRLDLEWQDCPVARNCCPRHRGKHLLLCRSEHQS